MSNDIDNIYNSCFIELYENAIDFEGNHGNYKQLVKEAKLNNIGTYNISNASYYLNQQQYVDIVEKWVEKIDEKDKNRFLMSIFWGPSPCCSKERFERDKQEYQRLKDLGIIHLDLESAICKTIDGKNYVCCSECLTPLFEFDNKRNLWLKKQYCFTCINK